MNKSGVLGLTLFIVAEILSVIALFSADWVVSKRLGTLSLGLIVLCHGAPEEEILCNFTIPHSSWLGSAMLLFLAVLLTGFSICLLVVALHKKKRSFEEAAKWSGLGGVIFMCLTGVLFPIGFAMAELGGQPYLLPPSFNMGYSYFLFYLSITVSIFAILATNRSFNRLFTCRFIRTTATT